MGNAMSFEIEATFEEGVLKPLQALPLQSGEKVRVTIHTASSAAERFCGSLPWTRDPDELRQFLADPDQNSCDANESS
jgi:predicted DNA-binding antitoxin AbrB/MazE fold protein